MLKPRLENEKLSLYVHIPFCEKKCFYCSFVIVVAQKHNIDDYLQCLTAEAQQYPNKEINSIYIGGGTPTFIDDDQIKNLFHMISTNFKFSKDIEITMEANPEGIDSKKAKFIKSLGVNRMSLGIQSLNNKYLKYLGRNHDRVKALATYRLLRNVGFTNINVDLMISLPDQSREEIIDDVKQMAQLDSQHISVYCLSIEENSKFYARKMALADDTDRGEEYLLVSDLLKQHGLLQYEISNFAKDGFESKHNINYWVGGRYIGLGVGAHSYMDNVRYWNSSNFSDYRSGIKDGQFDPSGQEEINPYDQYIEKILLGLRMNRGVNMTALNGSSNLALDANRQRMLDQFIQQGYLTHNNGKLTTTDKGKIVLDEICSKLI